mmetsp:Transcript_17516/g.41569  ORF Transcript_17516/g.41569 Transcript_17516/m.41569 type:complete len:253 (-) Transcript_17516:203-961(-)
MHTPGKEAASKSSMKARCISVCREYGIRGNLIRTLVRRAGRSRENEQSPPLTNGNQLVARSASRKNDNTSQKLPGRAKRETVEITVAEDHLYQSCKLHPPSLLPSGPCQPSPSGGAFTLWRATVALSATLCSQIVSSGVHPSSLPAATRSRASGTRSVERRLDSFGRVGALLGAASPGATDTAVPFSRGDETSFCGGRCLLLHLSTLRSRLNGWKRQRVSSASPTAATGCSGASASPPLGAALLDDAAAVAG